MSLFERRNAQVVKVYDADTITVKFDYSGHLEYGIRIFGVDSPEIRGNKDNDLFNIAKSGRDFAKSLIGKTVEIEPIKHDKYGGRLVGNIYIDGKSYSNMLIENKYAVTYNGGKKMSIEEMRSTLLKN